MQYGCVHNEKVADYKNFFAVMSVDAVSSLGEDRRAHRVRFRCFSIWSCGWTHVCLTLCICMYHPCGHLS